MFAYRVAEVRGSEAAGKDFLRRARALGNEAIAELAASALDGAPKPLASLSESLDDPDFVNGYLSGLSWRAAPDLHACLRQTLVVLDHHTFVQSPIVQELRRDIANLLDEIGRPLDRQV